MLKLHECLQASNPPPIPAYQGTVCRPRRLQWRAKKKDSKNTFLLSKNELLRGFFLPGAPSRLASIFGRLSFNCDNLGVVNKHTIGSVCKQCGPTSVRVTFDNTSFLRNEKLTTTKQAAAKRRPNAHPTFVHHHTMAKLGGPREMVSLMAWRLLTPAPTPSHPPTLPPRPPPFTTRTHTHLRGEFKISTKISSFFLLLLLLWLLHRL